MRLTCSGTRVRRDIKVFGMNPNQQIAHAAADQVAAEPSFLQGTDDADGVWVDPILVEMRLLSNVKHLENFHYNLSGNPSGKKLVFLHGLMGSAANWRGLHPRFKLTFTFSLSTNGVTDEVFIPPLDMRLKILPRT